MYRLLVPLAALLSALSYPAAPAVGRLSGVEPALPPAPYPAKVGDKWGHIDTTGRVVIAPQFDHAFAFSEGLALVSKGFEWYVLDAAGKVRFQAPWGPISKQYAGGFVVGTTDFGFRFYDRRGNVLPGRYALADDFSDGLAAVYVDEERFKPPHERTARGDVKSGKWGFIDPTGKMVIPPQYVAVGHFSSGLAPVYIGGVDRMCTGPDGGRWAYIDRAGKEAFEGRFGMTRPFSDGVAWVYVRAEREGDRSGYGLIDPTGKFLIEPRNYSWVGDFYEGLASVNGPTSPGSGRLGFQGVIDKTGRVVIPPRQLAGVAEFSEGLAAAQELVRDPKTKWWTQGSWGYIDRAGEWVIRPQFCWAGKFTGGMAAVGSPEDGFGHIDRQGRRYGWAKK